MTSWRLIASPSLGSMRGAGARPTLSARGPDEGCDDGTSALDGGEPLAAGKLGYGCGPMVAGPRNSTGPPSGTEPRASGTMPWIGICDDVCCPGDATPEGGARSGADSSCIGGGITMAGVFAEALAEAEAADSIRRTKSPM